MGYDGIIKALQQKREGLLRELQAVDSSLSQILLISGEPDVSTSSKQLELSAVPDTASGRAPYANISIKWACLWMLADTNDEEGLTTGEITRRLVEGGKQSKAYSFTSAVSAVLSNMKTNQELDQVGPFWQITPNGRLHFQMIESRLRSTALPPQS